jgi:arylsulfatase A-like enzyme
MVPVSLCCPSRTSTLTGLYSHSTGVYNGGIRSFLDDRHTLAVWLRRAGYRTALFGKYLNGYGRGRFRDYRVPGWDRWAAFRRPGFSSFDWLDRHGVLREGGSYSTQFFARAAARFVRSTPRRQPLFLYYAPYAVHAPAEPEEQDLGHFTMLERWRPPSYDVDPVDQPPFLSRTWTPEHRDSTDALRVAQHETMSSADRAVGTIMTALVETGRLRDTLFVLTSDNGLQWGEHRLKGKSVPYDASTHVPLLMRYDRAGWVGARGGVVANIDLAPTIADLAGIAHPRVEGRSLLPSLRRDEPVRRFLLLEHSRGYEGEVPSYCGVRSVRYLFVRYADGFEEMYDYRIDPWELDNIAADRPDLARKLRARTRALCDPVPPGFTWR